MAYRDRQLIMSEDQLLTTTAVSTNSLDLGDNVGGGEDLMLDVEIGVALASGTSVEFDLQDSADDSSFADILNSGVIAQATLVKGYVVWHISLPKTTRRFLQMNYTIIGTFDAGSVDAAIVPHIH